MALSTKTIKRRIKSITNTKKITKAMEMISAVKMRRAVANALSSRSYAQLAWEMLVDIAAKTNVNLHPLLAARPQPFKKQAIIVVTSNRGLAGGFNSKLLQAVHANIADVESNGVTNVEVVALGKKGRKLHQLYQHALAAEFEKIDLTTKMEEVLPLAELMTAEYIAKKYDQIDMAYTHFTSALQQKPVIKQIFPLTEKELNLLPTTGLEFKFEPDARHVLNMLLPRLIEMQIYQAIVESDASEHSARMLAMRSASDAAGDMIKELQTTFNNARQAGITKEIAEVIGGAAALE